MSRIVNAVYFRNLILRLSSTLLGPRGGKTCSLLRGAMQQINQGYISTLSRDMRRASITPTTFSKPRGLRHRTGSRQSHRETLPVHLRAPPKDYPQNDAVGVYYRISIYAARFCSSNKSISSRVSPNAGEQLAGTLHLTKVEYFFTHHHNSLGAVPHRCRRLRYVEIYSRLRSQS